MRKFSSYGPVDKELHYHVLREELIDRAYAQLVGKNPNKGGHYITVWAPRQAGKSWIMQQTLARIRACGDFEAGIITMQSAKEETRGEDVLNVFVQKLNAWFGRDLPAIQSWKEMPQLFTKTHFPKPLILIIDEFDALGATFINSFANAFRDMHMMRLNEAEKASGDKTCMLHGLALIGVRSVLGIENVSGSPFNVQRGLHIPNLTFEEVERMFRWHETESGQKVEPEVTQRLFYETRGQPGLTCWFGELLTEGFENQWVKPDVPITMKSFGKVYVAATDLLPNINIVNLISKAKQEPYREAVLELFKTSEKIPFRYDDPILNFLYMNGVIGYEEAADKPYVRFASPFVQKRLFNYFARELFSYMGKLYEPFEDLSDTFTESGLNIRNLMRRHQAHLKGNRDWLLKDAPRRKDLRIFEAVYHFNLYRYLCDFLNLRDAQVYPEFPTGNGKIDLIIRCQGQVYGVELKSYTDESGYHKALGQAALYGRQLGLSEISLIFFVEYVDDANREKYEKDHTDEETGVRVTPTFVETGN